MSQELPADSETDSHADDSASQPADDQNLQKAISVLHALASLVKKRVLGRDDVIDLAVIALVAGGHVLLEDFPGSGKTTLAKALGEAIKSEESAEEQAFAAFRRIQFTPDLLPSDVTGAPVFDSNSNAFHFRPGPLFAHIVLADEINRTSPKVQSAM
ncbi:MAG: AAA family ATPase, partial [Pseudomonadota bacterium]|nr:AAA family ATPase [Pseudomonadota bacterium]